MSIWTKKGSSILKDGVPQFLAGVAYAPTPCGGATYEPGVGDWFATPWNGIWERDFPLMKAAGINNIRTYFFWAWTPPRDMRTWQSVVNQKPAFDHMPFLDAAQANGISVTIGIALDGGNVFDNGSKELGEDYFNFYKATAVKLAEQYGKHDAVMGFCLGNEQNNQVRIVRDDFWSKLKEMADAVRGVAPQKLVMFAMQNDNPNMFTAVCKPSGKSVPQRFAEAFDVWGINIYSGMKETLTNYKNYVVNNPETQLPLVVSEWGIAGGKNVPEGAAGPPVGTATARELTPDEFQSRINELMIPDMNAMHSNLDFVAGSQFFEWTDEWWKNESTPAWEQNASASPDWPEEFWGLNSIAPNGRTAKDGPWNGQSGQPYPADIITARPTLSALSNFYKQIESGK
jgi:hypothetical protein